MPSILALDQGTTGSTALVIHQDGSVLGRGYREFTQHYPRPGWVEHDAEEILRVSLEAMREALAGRGRAPGRASASPTSARPWCCGTAAPSRRSARRSSGRTAAPATAAASSARPVLEPLLRERTGLVADPYFSATKLEWLLRDARAAPPGRAGRARRGHGRELAGRPAHRRRAPTSPITPTPPARCSTTCAAAGLGPGAARAVRRAAGAACRTSSRSAGVVAEIDAGHLGRRACRSPGLAGDQQAALFGQGCCSRRAGARTPTAPARSCWSTPASELPAPPRGRPGHRGLRPAGRAGLRARGQRLHRRRGDAVAPRRLGPAPARAAETEALARSVPDTGGVHFVPAFVGLGTPHWEAEARGTITGITRGTTRAHLVRAALEAMAFSSAELLAGDDRRRGGSTVPALRVDGGAAANDWLMQFQADVLGVPVERPDMVETTALGAAGLAGVGARRLAANRASSSPDGGSSGSSPDHARGGAAIAAARLGAGGGRGAGVGARAGRVPAGRPAGRRRSAP